MKLSEGTRIKFETRIQQAIGAGSSINPQISQDQRDTAISSLAAGFKGFSEQIFGLKNAFSYDATWAMELGMMTYLAFFVTDVTYPKELIGKLLSKAHRCIDFGILPFVRAAKSLSKDILSILLRDSYHMRST